MLDKHVVNRAKQPPVQIDVRKAVNALQHQLGVAPGPLLRLEPPKVPAVRPLIFLQTKDIQSVKRLVDHPIGLQIQFQIARHRSGPNLQAGLNHIVAAGELPRRLANMHRKLPGPVQINDIFALPHGHTAPRYRLVFRLLPQVNCPAKCTAHPRQRKPLPGIFPREPPCPQSRNNATNRV